MIPVGDEIAELAANISPIVPDLGTSVPEMGTSSAANQSGLASALFTPVQQTLLGLLFGQPDRRFHGRELIRSRGSGTGAGHRQLRRLAAVGIVTVGEEGNQKLYPANRKSPIFDELHGLVLKTVGAAEPIRRALEPLASQIVAAFVYGSLARSTDKAASDVDVW